MKQASPTLLPLLRSRAQGDILAWIMLHPDADHSLGEIAAAVGTSVPTVMREVNRLVASGLVTDMRRGNTRLVKADTDNPVYRPLAELMAVTFGPVGVLRESLAEVPGIDRAFIYGSWATRYQGQPGSVPVDIDVLVIGSPDRSALGEAVARAEKRLRREVNLRHLTAQAWNTEDSSFKKTVSGRPVVDLVGGDHG